MTHVHPQVRSCTSTLRIIPDSIGFRGGVLILHHSLEIEGLPSRCVINCTRLHDVRVTHANTTRQSRENRTITIDFQNEATYLQLLGDGKAFVECVVAFLCLWAFNSSTRRPVAAEAA